MLSIVYLVILLNFWLQSLRGSASDFSGMGIATPMEWLYMARHVHGPFAVLQILLC